MAKPSQTFKKRQRENKLREKAQQKRERRQQRGQEKKFSKEAVPVDNSSPAPQEFDEAPSDEPDELFDRQPVQVYF